MSKKGPERLNLGPTATDPWASAPVSWPSPSASASAGPRHSRAAGRSAASCAARCRPSAAACSPCSLGSLALAPSSETHEKQPGNSTRKPPNASETHDTPPKTLKSCRKSLRTAPSHLLAQQLAQDEPVAQRAAAPHGARQERGPTAALRDAGERCTRHL